MMSPVTSTKVATKGADDVAGSSPHLRSTNGSIAPMIEPHITMPTRPTPTVRATRAPGRRRTTPPSQPKKKGHLRAHHRAPHHDAHETHANRGGHARPEGS